MEAGAGVEEASAETGIGVVEACAVASAGVMQAGAEAGAGVAAWNRDPRKKKLNLLQGRHGKPSWHWDRSLRV